MAFHVRLSASCGKIFHIDGHAPMLHKGQAGDEFSAMNRYVEIDIWQHLPQQEGKWFGVAGDVKQDFRALLGSERPTLHDASPHRVFALAADVIDSEICQRAEQTFTLRHNAAVGYAAKFGT